MDRRRVITLPDGKKAPAVEVPVTGSTELWNEYILADGSVVRLKNVVTEILRVEDAYDAEGNPQYLLKSTQIVSVSPNERLRRSGD